MVRKKAGDWLRRLRFSLLLLLALALCPPAAASVSPRADSSPATDQVEELLVARRKKKKRKKRGKKKKKKKRKKKAGPEPEEEVPPDQLFDSSAPGGAKASDSPPPPPPAGETGALDLSEGLDLGDAGAAEEGVLDLSTVEDDGGPSGALLRGGAKKGGGKKKPKKAGGGFDFGGGFDLSELGDEEGGGEGGDITFEFGVEDFDMGAVDLGSAEQDRFDDAILSMSDEDYPNAAQEFRFFLDDEKFGDYREESEYQLAKALYKMGFLEPALRRFRTILDSGAKHRRYRKAVEWLFFISRKMADETPVLKELARYRNVKFPKAYQNEYRYLLAKYLFVQAQEFEAAIRREKEIKSGRQATKTLDFDKMAEVTAAAEDGSFDFGGGDAGGEGVDFGAFGGDAAGGGGFDFGGGGGEEAGGGGFDFGSGGDRGGDEGGFDFGGGGGGGGGDEGGFDFGGGGDAGALDFGGGKAEEKKPARGKDSPVREQAATTAEEAIKQGLELVEKVEDKSKFGPRARYLRGLLHYVDTVRGGKQQAVNSFQEVVRMLNPREGGRLDPVLREEAFLSLARVHYGAFQFEKSAYYYDLIDRDSRNWLVALFEASWAYYRRGDYEKALGNLLTLHAPFFEKEYFPESQIVKAIIYFEACRYTETREILERFIDRYSKVMQEIQRIAESEESAEELYSRIKTLQALASEPEDDVTVRIVNLALGDPEISRAQDVVRQVDEQVTLWNDMPDGFRTGKLGREVLDELKNDVTVKSKEAGEITRSKFEEKLYGLKRLVADAYRIKLEVVRAERNAIERRRAGEKTYDEIIPATPRTVVDDEHFYWPYEGEYWRDELGTYQLDFSMCQPPAEEVG